jgi:CRP/FNR family cyclic AMP-dependent transcriptional regulator
LITVRPRLAINPDYVPNGGPEVPMHEQRQRRAVAILDLDPDLAQDMDPERATAARSHAIAAVETLGPGDWPADALDIVDPRGALGLLVIDGILSRDLKFGGASFTELIGEGEILRPWDSAAHLSIAQPSVVWTVLDTARIAILDRRFVARTARWPELTTALFTRAMSRSRSLAVQLAIRSLQRVETRLLLQLWHLAERWGRVSPEGIVLPLQLTHRLLACLVGARRPTVTTALKELTHRGLVARRDDGTWMLRGAAPPELAEIYAMLS